MATFCCVWVSFPNVVHYRALGLCDLQELSLLRSREKKKNDLVDDDGVLLRGARHVCRACELDPHPDFIPAVVFGRFRGFRAFSESKVKGES